MNKLLCERPRGGWRLKTYRPRKHRPRQPEDWEAAPKRGRMAGKQRSSKWLNEHLGPLRRFLISKVGQPWDRVYSEIRADLKVRRAIDLHILQHLDQMVHVQARIDGPVPLVMGYAGWRELRGTRWDQLYVCPRTKRLRRFVAPRKARPRAHGVEV